MARCRGPRGGALSAADAMVEWRPERPCVARSRGTLGPAEVGLWWNRTGLKPHEFIAAFPRPGAGGGVISRCTQGGHGSEWLSPDDAEPRYVPQPVPTSADGFAPSGPGERRARGATRKRHGIAAVLMIGIVVVAAVVAVLGARTVRISVAGRPLAPIAAGAPAWLVNRPFSAGLSPDLAPQCVTGGCRFALASRAGPGGHAFARWRQLRRARHARV
jgi:hypothetical protein